ncbi:MAG: VWA domain-containing protein [Bacteroidetes bacterium]|nr:VWA domain-containing protein [Bacteroidota bacterium]
MFHLSHITFANRWVLWLIPVVAILAIVWWYLRQRKQYPTLTFSDTSAFKGFQSPVKGVLKKYAPLLRILSIGFLLVALARPQNSYDESSSTTEGIDIVLAMDVSTSMLSQDFKPNRLEAAKSVALDFVEGRPHDRIGLVVFAGESFTQCPVTIDHTIVKNQLKDIKNGILEDGTAIGMGLSTAVQRLKDSESKTKVVILMTDGVNNRGIIDPRMAADIAVQFGVRCYTIGVGKNGQALTPVAMGPNGLIFDYAEVQIDEALLRTIADKTGGKYYRSTDNKSLKAIFEQIDKLEKTKINVSAWTHKTEKFHLFALIAAALLLIEWVLRYTVLRSIP